MEITGKVIRQFKRCSENGITFAAILVEDQDTQKGEYLFTIDKPHGLLSFVRKGMNVRCAYEEIKRSKVLTKVTDIGSQEAPSRQYTTCTLKKILA